MSNNHFTFYLKPASEAALVQLLKSLAIIESKSEALTTTLVDEEQPISGAYRVPETILTHLRERAPKFEAQVYYEHRHHGVRALGSFKELVRQLEERRAA